MFSENHIFLNIFPIWFQGKLGPMVAINESFYPLNTFQLWDHLIIIRLKYMV